MAKRRPKRRFILRLPVLGVVDRKTLWHTGLVAALRSVHRPRSKEPVVLLFTDRALARQYIKTRSLVGSSAILLEPAGVLRTVLAELADIGFRKAAIDHPTADGHAWRPVAIAKMLAAIDAKLPPFADAVRLLAKAGRVTEAMLQADLAAGAPANPDGKIHLVHYAAWLVRETSGGD